MSLAPQSEDTSEDLLQTLLLRSARLLSSSVSLSAKELIFSRLLLRRFTTASVSFTAFWAAISQIALSPTDLV